MTEMATCSQSSCSLIAKYSYVWPGEARRMYACEYCLAKAKGVASAMGFELGDLREECDV